MPDVTVSESVDSFLRSADAAAARNNLGASSGVWPVSLGGTGRSTKPKTIRVKSPGAHQVIASGVDTRVIFGTSLLDGGISWTDSVATMPRDGWVTVAFAMTADAAQWYLRVYVNSDEYLLTGQANTGGGTWTALFPVTFNDTVEIIAQQPSGGDRSIYQSPFTRVTICYFD